MAKRDIHVIRGEYVQFDVRRRLARIGLETKVYRPEATLLYSTTAVDMIARRTRITTGTRRRGGLHYMEAPMKEGEGLKVGRPKRAEGLNNGKQIR